MLLLHRKYLLLLLLACCTVGLLAQDIQSLAGTWRFKPDEADQGLAENWQRERLPERIQLPGTTDEARYGEKTTGSDFGILTRAYTYDGPAWYQRDIEIPEEWRRKKVSLLLERVMWESRVFLDGKEVSVQDALSTPHQHELGYLQPGNHTLTIRIDNGLIHAIGDKGHAYTEYTQTIWNGVVGEIRLVAQEPVRMANPRIDTRVHPRTLVVTDTLVNETGKRVTARFHLTLKERESGWTVYAEAVEQRLSPGKNPLTHTAHLPESIRLWDDVHPNLYILELTLAPSSQSPDTREMEIGFREVTTSSSKIMVNGQPVFLRGNLDCVHFPLTGYPSCRVEDWERIFRLYKTYGLNHVRFHSWCPPKAAFTAADRVGIYIQAEVIWIDWWMTNTPPDRKDMITKGSPEGLGKNPSADAFVQQELVRMAEAYGNHASFMMQCIGNELGNSDFEVMESWIKPLQAADHRRLYAVSTARKIMPADQYMVTHYIQGIGSTRGLRGGASTDWDFEDVYAKATLPIIAHEIGQWPVYPRWSEIKKYKGVLKARNLEEFREVARRNHINEQDEAFARASGALNQLMYKYEIESFLRTPSCAGIQLLSMQDYQGQGEALVGWLDVFYDSKGITTPETFRCHMDTVVPLLRTPRFVWENNETFTAGIQLAQYGTQPLRDGLYWKIKDEAGNVIGEGQTDEQSFPVGSSLMAGKIACALSAVRCAQQLTVEVGLQREATANYWHIWVYPATRQLEEGAVYVTDRMDEACERQLSSGRKVLLLASALGTEQTADKLSFYPLYWSLTFFPGQGKNTLGMVVRDKHPVFGQFPTDSHSDWQWQSFYKNARAFYINDFPPAFQPMAQPVDDFHRNNKLAALFEVKAGNGKLLVCGFDLRDEGNPAARQLKRSILHYMQSPDFNPVYERDVDELKQMFTYVEPLVSTIPVAFDGALLYVDCGAEASGNVAWEVSEDRSESRKGTRYEVVCDRIAASGDDTAWEGKEVTLTVHCPRGIIGSLFVCLADEADGHRGGELLFEGRFFETGRQKEKASWVKLHVMREDSNDGMLVLKAKVKQGENLRIANVALVEE